MFSLYRQPVPGPRSGGIFSLPLAMACLLGWLAAPPGHAAGFTASLDRSTITLGDSATLSLRFEGAAPREVPQPPPVSNLEMVYRGPSSEVSFVNGQVTSTITHVFQVTPRKVGDFTIPALTALVGGQKLSSQPLRLRVLQPNVAAPEDAAAAGQIAFLRLVLPKETIYLGETIVAELQLYFANGVQNYGNFQFTALPADGLTVGKTAQGPPRRVQVGHTVFSLVPLQMALTAIKTGPVSLGPITANVVVELPSNRRRRDPFFERFGFPDLLGFNEQKQVPLATDAHTLQSLPLPAENVPPGFNGAVGTYTLSLSAGPTNVAAGDPITVRVQITGRGALDALTWPEQTAWQHFKTYPPTVNLELADPLGLQGTKTFEQIVTPQSTEIHELPPFSFSFFDPEQKTYRTLTHPAVALTVRPGGAAPAPVIAAGKRSRADEPPPAQDIVHIKARPGTLARIGPPWVMQPWFVAAQTAPVLAFLAAFLWRKRAESLANNPRLRRQRHVAQIVRAGLAELRRHAAAKNSDAFFATLVRLLQEQIGERLDCPASAITEAVVDEKLRPLGLPEATLAALHELFQAANLARYAPVRSEQEFAVFVPKLENVLRALQEVKT